MEPPAAATKASDRSEAVTQHAGVLRRQAQLVPASIGPVRHRASRSLGNAAPEVADDPRASHQHRDVHDHQRDETDRGGADAHCPNRAISPKHESSSDVNTAVAWASP